MLAIAPCKPVSRFCNSSNGGIFMLRIPSIIKLSRFSISQFCNFQRCRDKNDSMHSRNGLTKVPFALSLSSRRHLYFYLVVGSGQNSLYQRKEVFSIVNEPILEYFFL